MSKTIDGQEYLTVKELADAVGYTPQAIYKMLNNPLNELNKKVKRVKSVTYILKSALEENFVETETTVSTNSLNSLNLIETASTKEEKKEADNNKITEAVIEMLRAELETKNRQIEELNNRLAETTQALTKAQELTHREQELNAVNILKFESTEQKKENFFKRIFKKKQKIEE